MIETFAKAAISRVKGFDPAAIIAIIQAIIAMIGNCPAPAAAAVRSGNIGMFRRAQVMNYLLRTGDHAVLGHAAALAHAICDEAVAQQSAIAAGPAGDWCDQMIAEADEK